MSKWMEGVRWVDAIAREDIQVQLRTLMVKCEEWNAWMRAQNDSQYFSIESNIALKISEIDSLVPDFNLSSWASSPPIAPPSELLPEIVADVKTYSSSLLDFNMKWWNWNCSDEESPDPEAINYAVLCNIMIDALAAITTAARAWLNPPAPSTPTVPRPLPLDFGWDPQTPKDERGYKSCNLSGIVQADGAGSVNSDFKGNYGVSSTRHEEEQKIRLTFDPDALVFDLILPDKNELADVTFLAATGPGEPYPLGLVQHTPDHKLDFDCKWIQDFKLSAQAKVSLVNYLPVGWHEVQLQVSESIANTIKLGELEHVADFEQALEELVRFKTLLGDISGTLSRGEDEPWDLLYREATTVSQERFLGLAPAKAQRKDITAWNKRIKAHFAALCDLSKVRDHEPNHEADTWVGLEITQKEHGCVHTQFADVVASKNIPGARAIIFSAHLRGKENILGGLPTPQTEEEEFASHFKSVDLISYLFTTTHNDPEW